jgi:Protein of unknown function (DUF2516)
VVSVLGNGVYTPLTYFFVALALAGFVIDAWAFVDAIVRPAPAFLAAQSALQSSFLGRLTKTYWLLILGVAFVLGLYAAAYSNITFAVIAFVAASVYLAAVRPKLREFRKGRSSSSSGPYGGW